MCTVAGPSPIHCALGAGGNPIAVETMVSCGDKASLVTYIAVPGRGIEWGRVESGLYAKKLAGASEHRRGKKIKKLKNTKVLEKVSLDTSRQRREEVHEGLW